MAFYYNGKSNLDGETWNSSFASLANSPIYLYNRSKEIQKSSVTCFDADGFIACVWASVKESVQYWVPSEKINRKSCASNVCKSSKFRCECHKYATRSAIMNRIHTKTNGCSWYRMTFSKLNRSQQNTNKNALWWCNSLEKSMFVLNEWCSFKRCEETSQDVKVHQLE